MKAKVSILSCEDYESEKVYEKVKAGLNFLGGIESFITRGEQVLLKPNFIVGRPPEKCANTHPEIVKAIARLVLETGANPVIGDGPPPTIGSAAKVAEKCGVAEVAREMGIKIVEFEPVEVKHSQGNFFKNFTIGKAVLEADKIINLPKLKTHSFAFLTLAVKNIFGCIPGARKTQWHMRTSQQGSEYFAGMLLDLCTLINPVLSVVDGIFSMEGEKGPISGKPKKLGLIISGTNALAVDAVIAEVLGVQPEQFPELKVALNKDYETVDLNEIEVLGEPIEKVKINDFQFTPTVTELRGFPRILLGFMKDQLTIHPFINNKLCQKCNSCVEACPLKCITTSKNEMVINSKECIQCMCCMEGCIHGAIELREGSLLKLFKFFKKNSKLPETNLSKGGKQ